MRYSHALLVLSLLAASPCVVLARGEYDERSKPTTISDYDNRAVNDGAPSDINTVYYFDQLIDHDNPDTGTFQQRFWTSWESYEPGGPIVLFSPGESSADGFQQYLLNASLMGLLAQEENGATVLLEHRFFGMSNPYNNLSVESLQFLTIEQSAADFAYFAQNVVLPMPGGGKVAPGEAPWFYFGASYSGALVSWTMVQEPGVFWAGYASSSVVETITDFWAYFEPIRQNMAKNCSADVEAVISQLTSVFTNGDAQEIQAAKDNWGLGELSEDLDFLSALRNNFFDWQSLQPDSEGGLFLEFCDALEIQNGVSANASGWGLDYAYQAWGAYWNTSYYTDICGNQTVEECLGTYDASSTYYTDISINNANRSWMWLVCNYLGWYQDGPPADCPAIVSPLITASYLERQCTLLFPGQFNDSTPTPAVAQFNSVYEGWDVNIDRLFFANGIQDPWRYATVSSPFTNRTSTTLSPITIGDGYHASDFFTANAAVNPSIQSQQQEALAYFSTWLQDWQPSPRKHTWVNSSGPRTMSGGKDVPQSTLKPKAINGWARDRRPGGF